MIHPPDNLSINTTTTTTPGAPPPLPPQQHNVAPTNTLLLINIPRQFFQEDVSSGLLQPRLKALLSTYGLLHHFVPLKSFKRIMVVYDTVEAAQKAKFEIEPILARLFEEAGYTAHTHNDSVDAMQVDDDVNTSHLTNTPLVNNESESPKVYYGAMTAVPHPDVINTTNPPSTQVPNMLNVPNPNQQSQFLQVPQIERNFLLSPPGSPPIGWVQIRESGPSSGGSQDLYNAIKELEDEFMNGTAFSIGDSMVESDSLPRKSSLTAATSPKQPEPTSTVLQLIDPNASARRKLPHRHTSYDSFSSTTSTSSGELFDVPAPHKKAKNGHARSSSSVSSLPIIVIESFCEDRTQTASSPTLQLPKTQIPPPPPPSINVQASGEPTPAPQFLTDNITFEFDKSGFKVVQHETGHAFMFNSENKKYDSKILRHDHVEFGVADMAVDMNFSSSGSRTMIPKTAMPPLPPSSSSL